MATPAYAPMAVLYSNPAANNVKLVYSQDLPWRTPSSFNDRRLLVVQLSHFDCGVTAVSVCISHKIVDAYSISKFLNDWAAITREPDLKPSP
ncbi:hypothetical protein R3W88_005723 [Solanum pinnatisectum]|uniref:Uncharacterized protein n=1 Tax=Solanum pinnatisectum TaxID=50273 RepID=A0AAV9KF08_9SOLN|nr:hypothetical protein R3W88_005723 [Solanum pinnatisectum]